MALTYIKNQNVKANLVRKNVGDLTLWLIQKQNHKTKFDGMIYMKMKDFCLRHHGERKKTNE